MGLHVDMENSSFFGVWEGSLQHDLAALYNKPVHYSIHLTQLIDRKSVV